MPQYEPEAWRDQAAADPTAREQCRLLDLLDEFATIGGAAHNHGDQIYALAMALYPTSILEEEQNETDSL